MDKLEQYRQAIANILTAYYQMAANQIRINNTVEITVWQFVNPQDRLTGV
jgi:hypothetical protein